MKKLFVLILVIITTNVSAQKMYFRGGVGYAMSHGGAVQSPVFSYSTRTILPSNGSYSGIFLPTNTSESFELSRVSYTAGIQGILAMGMMLNKNIGVEVAANIGFSTKQMKLEHYLEQSQVKTWLNVVQQSDIPVMLTPALVIQTGGKINLYARGGIVIPLQSAILQEIDYAEEKYNPADSTFVNRTVKLNEDFRMRMNPGFSGAMGLKFKTGKQVTVWAEAGILSMTLYYKSSEIVRYDQDGQSVLNLLSPNERTTQYEFKGTISNNSNTVPTYQAAFSNFNITAGVMIDLL